MLALILFACTEQSQNNTHNRPQEKKQNVVVDSTLDESKCIDTTNIEIGFDLGYISMGKLFLYNSNLKTQSEFQESSDIFNCVFDKASATLYYTIVDSNDSLSLKKAELEGGIMTSSFIDRLHLHRSNCESLTYGEKSKLIFNSGSLFLRHTYSWEVGSYATEVISYNLNNNELTNFSDWTEIQELEKTMYPESKKSDLLNNMFSNEVDGILELFLRRENDTLQLSETSSLHDENMDVEGKAFGYEISPDASKLLFSVLVVVGDLGHGPYYIVNIDGKEQKHLETDFANTNRPKWIGKNNLIYLVTEYDVKNKNDLNLIHSEDNLIQKISEDVDYYFVVE